MELPKGVTYRQVQDWIAHGYIFDDSQVAPGRGHYRKWTREARRRVIAMGKLRAAGFETPVAARLARELTEVAELLTPGPCAVEIRDGMWLNTDLLDLFPDEGS